MARRLQAYEQIQQAARWLGAQPLQGREVFWAATHHSHSSAITHPSSWTHSHRPGVPILSRVTQCTPPHPVRRERLSVKDRLQALIQYLSDTPQPFRHLLKAAEGREGLVVTFLALLSLMQWDRINASQTQSFAEIEISRHR